MYHWKSRWPDSCAAAVTAPSASARAATGMLRVSMRITDCLRKVSAPGGSRRLTASPAAVRQNARTVLESAGGEGEQGRRYLLGAVLLAETPREASPPVERDAGARGGPSGATTLCAISCTVGPPIATQQPISSPTDLPPECERRQPENSMAGRIFRGSESDELNEAELSPDLGEGGERLVEIVPGVRGGDLATHAGLP